MRVVVLTDNGFATEAIRRALRHASGIQLAGYIDGRRSCAAAISDAQPDLVIVDEMTWSACAVNRIAEIRVCAPESKIVALASVPGSPWLADAVEAGAHAAIAKTVEPTMLGPLVREIWLGNVHHAFDSTHTAFPSGAAHGNLTARELEILRLVAAGSSNRRIAQRLCITDQTVKFHLSNVYRKLGVSNRTQASRYAHVHRLIGTQPSPVSVKRTAA